MYSKKEKSIAVAGVIVLSIFVYFSDPSKGPILPCLFNKITGLYCPGCGMTRAVHSLLRLNLYQAFRFNALIFILPMPLLLYYYAYRQRNEKLKKLLLAVMFIIVIGYGIMRNMSIFGLLAPSILT